MRHPAVRALSHPKGRIINHRPPNALDLERTFEVALETGVAIETNGLPDRLDLSGPEIRLAIEAGVPIVVSTDAHSVRGLGNMRLAVHTARRGWATAADVVNTRPLDGGPQREQNSGPRIDRTVPPYRLTAPRTSSARSSRQTHMPSGGAAQCSGWLSTSRRVHRRADAVLVIEAEHVAELVRDDQRHHVAILSALDPDLGARRSAR